MSRDHFHAFLKSVCSVEKRKWDTCEVPNIQQSGGKRKKKEERKTLVSPTNMHPSQSDFFFSPSSFTRGRENELEFRLQHIRLPAFRVPLMRLDQGRSTGGFRAEGRLWCLYGGRSTSGQGCPMVGLHLVDQCFICVQPFPAADKQEDTSAKLLIL